MPTPLTYLKVQTTTGSISIPIYNVGELPNNSFRVMTSKGLGCYDLIPPTAATPFRVMTSNGVMGINMNTETVVTVNRNNIRYVREWLGGNNLDNMRIWCEIQVKNAIGTNLALNKPVTHSVPPDGTWYSKEQVNDGIVDMVADNNAGVVGPSGDYTTPLYIQIDLQAGYPITEIKVWHNYLNNRTYQSVKLQISEDGTVWETLFDSEVAGRYLETAAGKTHLVPSNLLLYSEDFSQTAWLKGASTTAIATNVAMPIGTGTYLSQMKTVVVGQIYTFTVWVQANAGDYSDFDIFAGRTNAFTIDYGSKVCTPTDTLTAHSFTFTATTTTCYVGFDNVNGQTSPNIIAKAKLELGATSTSYIKTP